jgi:hypothetical protein
VSPRSGLLASELGAHSNTARDGVSGTVCSYGAGSMPLLFASVADLDYGLLL